MGEHRGAGGGVRAEGTQAEGRGTQSAPIAGIAVIADIAHDRKGKTCEEGAEMRRTAKVERSKYRGVHLTPGCIPGVESTKSF
jgi:hypothetical protein